MRKFLITVVVAVLSFAFIAPANALNASDRCHSFVIGVAQEEFPRDHWSHAVSSQWLERMEQAWDSCAQMFYQ